MSASASQNSAPSFVSLDGSPVFVESPTWPLPSSTPVVLDANVQILDTELDAAGSYAGSRLTLARAGGPNRTDFFSARDGGTISALSSGEPLIVNGVTIGSVSKNADGTLELAFAAAATQALVSQAMQQIAYSSTDDAPASAVTIAWNFSDGNAGAPGTGAELTASGQTTVLITPTNDSPRYDYIRFPFPEQPTLIAGRPFSYTIPAGAFFDQENDPLTFWARPDLDGASWLSFDPVTRTLSGTPTVAGQYGVHVYATDHFPSRLTLEYKFTVLPEDFVAPKFMVAEPSNDTLDVPVISAVRLYFDETVVRGTGAITLQDSRGTVLQSLDIAGSSAITIGSSMVQLQFAAMPYGTELFVVVPAGAFADMAGNASAALDLISFTTASLPNQLATGIVAMYGATLQGESLTAVSTLQDADGLGALQYQWLANGIAINGATGKVLNLGEAQVGTQISVRVSFTDGIGHAESATSYPSAIVQNVNDAPSGGVTIKGSASQGATLSATATIADADGLGELYYQWFVSGTAHPIATGPSLVLEQAHVGKTVSVQASYHDGHGTAEKAMSASTSAVVNVNDLPSGSVTIEGLVKQDNTVTAVATLADTDGLGPLAYQWFRSGVALAGATAKSLLLTEADVGKVMTVVASYVDGFGKQEAVSSLPRTTASRDNLPGSVSVLGSDGVGSILFSSILDVDGTASVKYQWQTSVDGVVWADIAGATDEMFTIGVNEATAQIRVLANYTDSKGNIESLSSNPLGGTGNDRLIGTVADERLWAGAGNDFIVAGGGTDHIRGDGGVDSVSFSGAYANYLLQAVKGGLLIAGKTASDGSATLIDVERLLFADTAIALDTGATGSAGQSYRLYQAAFARTPDKAGVGYWMAAMDQGMPLAVIAANFLQSAEYKALYPATLSNADLIGRYYQNILGRPAEQSGLDYWTGVLDNKVASVAEVLALISESSENVTTLASVIGAGFPYTPFG